MSRTTSRRGQTRRDQHHLTIIGPGLPRRFSERVVVHPADSQATLASRPIPRCAATRGYFTPVRLRMCPEKLRTHFTGPCLLAATRPIDLISRPRFSKAILRSMEKTVIMRVLKNFRLRENPWKHRTYEQRLITMAAIYRTTQKEGQTGPRFPRIHLVFGRGAVK